MLKFKNSRDVVEKWNHGGCGCGQFGDFDLYNFGVNFKSNVFTRYWISLDRHSTFLLGRNRFVIISQVLDQVLVKNVDTTIAEILSYKSALYVPLEFGLENKLSSKNCNILIRKPI